MSFFNIAYKTVRSNEGGYRNVTWDAGGETYKGIARNFHPGWEGWKLVDVYKKTHKLKNGDIIPDPVLDKMVVNFFQNNFWIKNNLQLITNASMATLLLDMVIQHGRGPRIINETVNAKIKKVPQGVTVRIETVQAINNDTATAYTAIAEARVNYVESLKNSLGKDYTAVLARAKRFLGQYGKQVSAAGVVGFFLSFTF